MVVQTRGDWQPTFGPKQVNVHQRGEQEKQHLESLQLSAGDTIELAHIGHIRIKSVSIGEGMRPKVVGISGDSINILQILRKVPKE